MAVVDSATKLANDIKNSKEYKDFRKYMSIIKSNPKYELTLNNYKKSHIHLRFL